MQGRWSCLRATCTCETQPTTKTPGRRTISVFSGVQLHPERQGCAAASRAAVVCSCLKSGSAPNSPAPKRRRGVVCVCVCVCVCACVRVRVCACVLCTARKSESIGSHVVRVQHHANRGIKPQLHGGARVRGRDTGGRGSKTVDAPSSCFRNVVRACEWRLQTRTPRATHSYALLRWRRTYIHSRSRTKAAPTLTGM